MMELHWTLDAIQDRERIYDYIEADNPSAALALDELFAPPKSTFMVGYQPVDMKDSGG